MEGTVLGDRVLTPTGWIGPALVRHADGLITGIEPVASGRGDGTTIVPGFIDIQVNGKADIAVDTRSDQSWDRLERLVRSEGVTSWFPTTITSSLDRMEGAVDRLAGRIRNGCAQGLPDPVGIHVEGPFLGSEPGVHPVAHIVGPDLGFVQRLPPEVRLMTVGGQDPMAPTLVRRLVERGVVVSLGHTNPTREQLDAVLGAGVSMVTHLFNACGPMHQRSPGLIPHALAIDGLAVSFIADGIHVDPAWLGVIAAAKRPQDQILITDSVAVGGSLQVDPTGPVARSVDGTMAGSMLTMDAAIRRMVDEVGVDLEHACRAASTNPAAVLGLSDRGQITPGRRADLTILDVNLHVAGVVVAGLEGADPVGVISG